MHVLDILEGAGLACAAGVRPFLPALLVGALASGSLGVDFHHTHFAFLGQVGFLAGVVAALIVVVVLERRLGTETVERGPVGAAIAGVGIGVGALMFAGVLAYDHEAWWPGLVAGVACATLAQFAARSLLARTRRRLDRSAAAALPLYADGFGLALAGGAGGFVGAGPAGLDRGHRLLPLAAGRRPPARGEQARRPADPALRRVARA
jgi:hypothetical protein